MSDNESDDEFQDAEETLPDMEVWKITLFLLECVYSIGY